MSPDEERVAEALAVQRLHGANARIFVATRIGALALAGDADGVARWRAIAHKLAALPAREDAIKAMSWDPAKPDPYAVLRRRLQKKLVGFSADISDEAAKATMLCYRPARALFPVPELVFFALRDVLGWRWFGNGEKVRWTVSGTVDGERVAFELRKFGFTIYHPQDRPDLQARVEGQLRSALRDVEAFLKPLAKAQVGRGEVMIINRFPEFDARYRFFRRHAETAFAKASEPAPAPPITVASADPAALRSISEDISAAMNATLTAEREGFFHSTAMVDSYFSCLEHRLVLLRSFSGKPFAQGDVLELLAMPWDEKLKLLFPHPLPRAASMLLGKLRRIKERVRNPFAHGGVENDQGSLFFRLPGIGAIPANFTKFGDSVRFSVLPVGADDHAEICAAFDAVDDLLCGNALAGPDQLLKGGVDPVFDAASIAEYAAALTGGPEAVESYIESWSNRWERHVNMDY